MQQSPGCGPSRANPGLFLAQKPGESIELRRNSCFLRWNPHSSAIRSDIALPASPGQWAWIVVGSDLVRRGITCVELQLLIEPGTAANLRANIS